MLEILRFCFQDFWHFVGTFMMLTAILKCICYVVAMIKGVPIQGAAPELD
jgi:hypothetical protein